MIVNDFDGAVRLMEAVFGGRGLHFLAIEEPVESLRRRQREYKKRRYHKDAAFREKILSAKRVKP